MKKGLIIYVSLIVLFSVLFVSSGFFGDLSKEITGKSLEITHLQKEAVNPSTIYLKGTVGFDANNYNDESINSILKEYPSENNQPKATKIETIEKVPFEKEPVPEKSFKPFPETVIVIGIEKDNNEDVFYERDREVNVLKKISAEEEFKELKQPSQELDSYLVEFKKMPLLKKRTALNKEKDKKLEDYRKELKLEHNLALSDIKNILINDKETDSMKKITNDLISSYKPGLEFYNVFNGVVLEITKGDAEKIRQSKYVKNVYLDLEVHTLLMDSVPLINADDVWQLDRNLNNCTLTGKDCLTGKNVTIAIIDTGVDYTHSELGGCFGTGCKVIGGYDIYNNDSNPMDDHGHGTHVAGTAAGSGNGIGALKGVAPDAEILAYKVLSKYGSGTWSGVIAGVELAVDPNQDGNFSDHADIISLSLGGYGNPDDPLSQAVDNAVGAGVVAVIAAGNSGPGSGTILSPGTARKAITVGATDKSDNLASFSSRGPVNWSTNGSDYSIVKPDISAPGVNIYAPYLNNAYTYLSGTSMATPHVSGAAALLLQRNPDWTPDQIKEILKNTSISLPYTENEAGKGRLDVLAAINFVVADWTQWFDRDDPSGYGDYETLKELKNENPGEICDSPTNIECQTTTGLDYAQTGEVVTCGASSGLVCRNADQADGKCDYDYKVRFYCT